MVQVGKQTSDTQGIMMIEKMLEKYKDTLPEAKSMKDFGGGYVEILKTKAKVVLYFGFTSANNRVQIKFDIRKEDVLHWENAIAQKLWNKDSDEVEEFEQPSFTSETFGRE